MSFGGVVCFRRVMVTRTDRVTISLVVLAVKPFYVRPLPLHSVVMIKFLVVIALSVPLHYLFQCLGTEPRALHMLKISI